MSDDKLVCGNTLCVSVCLRAGIYVCVYTGKGAPCLMTNLCVLILCVCVCVSACWHLCVCLYWEGCPMFDDKLVCVNTLCVSVCLRAGIYVCVYTGKGAPWLMTNLCVLILCVCVCLCVCVLAFMCVSILGRVPDV